MNFFFVPGGKGKQGENFAYPGVEPHAKGQERTLHAYYQWVPFVLFFQVRENTWIDENFKT